MARKSDPYGYRQQAKAAGQKTYRAEFPCVNGHNSPRYTSTNICIECRKFTFIKQYAKNKQKLLANTQSWRDKNRTYVNEYARQYREKYHEKVLECVKQSRRKYKEKHVISQRMRELKKLQATPPWMTNNDFERIKEYLNKAKDLSKKSGIKMHVDHIVPIKGKTVCGLNVPWNLRIIDGRSNSRKSAKLTDDAYLPALPGLLLGEGALPWNWSKA